MSPRTYIGPFGRILPLPEGSEPEQAPSLHADDERTGLQLPRPALNFGSDTTLGFSDPTRYNTSSHSRRTQDPRFSHADQSTLPSRESLPHVKQLLTPGSQPSIPTSPYSSQQSSVSSHRKSSVASSRHGSNPEQVSEPSYRPQGIYQHPQGSNLGLQSQPLPLVDTYLPPGQLQQSPQAFMTAQSVVSTNYDPYGAIAQQAPYEPQSSFAQRPHPSALSISQRSAYQRESGPPMNPPAQYYPDAPGNYGFAPPTAASSVQNQRTSPSVVQPAPRVVSEDVTAEGPVWVYEDGTTCPKVIDGEQVNAEWGVTKAGKPRKRLAIACTSCREKKIKCDPAEPKCVQCEKNGRFCKFATALRHPPIKSESPSYESQARLKFVTVKKESTPQNTMSPRVPPSERQSIKHFKRSTESPVPQLAKMDATRLAVKFADLSPSVQKRRAASPIGHTRSTNSKIKQDPQNENDKMLSPRMMDQHKASIKKHSRCPSDIDAQVINHYIDMYFTNINACGSQGPQHEGFLHWFDTAKAKSPDSLMIVHAMLAVGTTFSSRPEREADGILFSGITRRAMEEHPDGQCAQVAQTRLMLALYYMASGFAGPAWDLAASELPAALSASLEDGYEKKAKWLG